MSNKAPHGERRQYIPISRDEAIYYQRTGVPVVCQRVNTPPGTFETPGIGDWSGWTMTDFFIKGPRGRPEPVPQPSVVTYKPVPWLVKTEPPRLLWSLQARCRTPQARRSNERVGS